LALSVQKVGASESREISSTRPRFRSTSKRPPERLQAARQLGEAFLHRSSHGSQVSRGFAPRRLRRTATARAAAVAAAHAHAKKSPNLV